MSKFLRTVKMAPTDIKTNVYVRKEIDQEWVMTLAFLIDAGTPMKTRMRVTGGKSPMGTNHMIDGRQRKEAFELAGATEVEVDLWEVEDLADLIILAHNSNTGGSRPPTREDYEYVIEQLLAEGLSRPRIAEAIQLPIDITRKLVKSVEADMEVRNLQRAVTGVTDEGLTQAQAAERHGVDPDKLKSRLSGVRRKSKKGINGLEGRLSQSFKSHGLKVAAMLRELLAEFEDGQVSGKQVEHVLKDIDRLQKQHGRRVSNWKKRFAARAAVTAQ